MDYFDDISARLRDQFGNLGQFTGAILDLDTDTDQIPVSREPTQQDG